MARKFFVLLTIGIGFFLFYCQENEPEITVVENTKLKQGLQGVWSKTFKGQFNEVYNSLEFDEYTLYWRDSTVNFDQNLNGEIQTVAGSCPVIYTFRDGINHYNPMSYSYYMFSGTTENNILWVYTNKAKSIIRDYNLIEGIVEFEEEWTADLGGHITSSYVIFHNDTSSVEFCGPFVGWYDCSIYDRE